MPSRCSTADLGCGPRRLPGVPCRRDTGFPSGSPYIWVESRLPSAACTTRFKIVPCPPYRRRRKAANSSMTSAGGQRKRERCAFKPFRWLLLTSRIGENLVQELAYHRLELAGLLDLRRVTGFLEDHQTGVRDQRRDGLGRRDRGDPVRPAHRHQGRAAHAGKL